MTEFVHKTRLMSPTELYFLKQFFSYNSQGQEEKKKGQGWGKKERKPTNGKCPELCVMQMMAKQKQSNWAPQLRAPSEGLESHSRCLLVPAAVFLSWGPAASSSLSFSSSPGHLGRWSVLWPKTTTTITTTEPVKGHTGESPSVLGPNHRTPKV